MKSTFSYGAALSGYKAVWETIPVLFGNEKSLGHLYGASWIELAYVYVVSLGEVCKLVGVPDYFIAIGMSCQLTNFVFMLFCS